MHFLRHPFIIIYKSEKSRKNIDPVVYLVVTKQANNGLDIDQISA